LLLGSGLLATFLGCKGLGLDKGAWDIGDDVIPRVGAGAIGGCGIAVGEGWPGLNGTFIGGCGIAVGGGWPGLNGTFTGCTT